MTDKVAGPDGSALSEGLGPTPLPTPAGFRTRYRSELGMIGHYPWTYADAGRRKGSRPECEYEDLFTGDQVRAAMAALRKPLTRQQIDAVMTEHYPLSSLLREEVDAFEACVRDIERLHGIGA